jgi:hypothetical protein
MMLNDWLITMILGGVFVLFGLGGVLWGKKEASEDYQSITARADVHTDTRKFLEDWKSYYNLMRTRASPLVSLKVKP